MITPQIFIGFDPREAAAFAVACLSVRQHIPSDWPVRGLVLSDLQRRKLYRRPMEMRPSAADRPVMWDVISDAVMSTEHANARFLVPYIAQHGWAMFMDGDILVRSDLTKLFANLDPGKAVYCVHHCHEPTQAVKMDGQPQTIYPKKNWTSVIIWNCDHVANRPLTQSLDLANTAPGRDLHALCWLADCDIGELDPSWNWLVGHSDPSITPDIAHFTSGIPDMPGYEAVPYANEWRIAREQWAVWALSLPG